MKDDVRLGHRSLAAAVSLALATAFTTGASAAEDDEEESPKALEEVVVTSFRRSLENSMDLKRESASIVEAVSAEEIGKLPDVSIAESLARLPGLTAQRLNGRGQVISVRGLAPDFTTALLNGRPQVSTGDNRGVEFDQYPSELLSSVVVYKTPDASLIGQGLAGTADLRTIRPLEYGRQAFAGNIRYERNQFDTLNAGSSNDGIRYSLSYVDQFRDDKIGLALGFAHMNNPSQEERWNAWGYTGVADDLGLPEGTLAIQGAKPFVRSSDLNRDGLIAVMEFRPTPEIETSFDLYASNFNEKQWLRGIELPLTGEGAILIPGTVANGLVTSGTFENVEPVVRNDINERDTQLRAVGWNFAYDVNDDWGIELDASYSAVNRSDRLLETYSGTGPEDDNIPDTLGFELTGAGGIRFDPTIDYTDPNQIVLASPQGWGRDIIPGGQLGYTNNPVTDDELAHFTASAKRYMQGAFASVEFGVNFNRRAKSLVANEFFLGLADSSFSAPIPNPVGITSLEFLGIPGMISYNPLEALDAGVYRLERNAVNDVIIKSWSVEEDVGIAYTQFNLDTIWRSIPVTGNMGLQFVYTDQFSNAFGAGDVDDVIQTVPISGRRSYKDILPSVNISFEVGENKFVRVGAARTLARPRMDELRASESFSFDDSKTCADLELVEAGLRDCDLSDLRDSPWSTTGGNPQLDPWVANALDISYEQYFADRAGYFAIAGFYKDLESYVFNGDTAADFTGFPVPAGLTPATFRGQRTRPENGTGGRVSGVELAFSMNFDILTEKLQGFGLVASASFTDSSIQPDPDDPSEPLPGLSEEVSNITLFYERAGFSGRVSRRHRSEFLGEVSGFGAGREFHLVKGEAIVDAQIGYSFTQGPLAGFSILLQGNNLTDEPFTTFTSGDARQVRDFQRYGRTYLLGASFKY